MKLESKDLHTERLDLLIPTMKEQYRLWEILKDENVNKWYFPTPNFIFDKNSLRKDKIEDLKKARKLFMDRFSNWNIQEEFYSRKIERIKNKENSDIFTWSIFLKDTDIVIGQITCQPNSEYKTTPEIRDIGWYIDPDYQNKGYGKEASTKVVDFMFNEVEISDIYTSAATDNKGSCGLMHNLGFEEYGTYMSTYFDENDKILECTKFHGNKELFLNRNNK